MIRSALLALIAPLSFVTDDAKSVMCTLLQFDALLPLKLSGEERMIVDTLSAEDHYRRGMSVFDVRWTRPLTTAMSN